jgi:serine/threonine protein kinase
MTYKGPIKNFDRGDQISMMKRPLPVLDPTTQNTRQAVVPADVFVSNAILDCAFSNIKPVVMRFLFERRDGEKYNLETLSQNGAPVVAHSMFWDLICIITACKFALSFSGLVPQDDDEIDDTIKTIISLAIRLVHTRTPRPVDSLGNGLYKIGEYDCVFTNRAFQKEEESNSYNYKTAMILWTELVNICSLITLKDLEFDDPCSARLFDTFSDKSNLMKEEWITTLFEKLVFIANKIISGESIQDPHMAHYNVAVESLGDNRARVLFPTDSETRLFYVNANLMTPRISTKYELGSSLGSGSYGQVRTAERKPVAPTHGLFTLAAKNVDLQNLHTYQLREIFTWYKLAARNPSNYISKIEDFMFSMATLYFVAAFDYPMLKVNNAYFIAKRGVSFDKLFREMSTYSRNEQASQGSSEIHPWYFQLCIRCLAHIVAGLKHMKKLNIVHFDLKPANLIFDYTKGYVQITDFGSAVPLDPSVYGAEFSDWNTSQFATITTKWFKSPEAILGEHGPNLAVGPWSDMWSVGCIAYQLFDERNAYSFPGEDSSDFSQLISIFEKLGTPALDTPLMQHADSRIQPQEPSPWPKFKRKDKLLNDTFLGTENAQLVEEFLASCFRYDTSLRITPDIALDTSRLIKIVDSPLDPITSPSPLTTSTRLNNGWKSIMPSAQ